MDSVFNWMEHLEIVRSKIILFTCNMRKVRLRDLGASIQFLKMWYDTVLKKQVSYGHEVYG